jgi:hypothetical protein
VCGSAWHDYENERHEAYCWVPEARRLIEAER